MESLRNLIIETYKMRLIGLIGYGTYFNKSFLNPNDIDLVVILKNKKEEDIFILKELISISNIKLLVHSQVIDKEEFFRKAEYFTHHTQGAYFISVLQKGKTLYGENIYKKYGVIDKKLEKLSLLAKVRQYNYEIINYYLNKFPSKDDFDVEVRKRCRKINTDLSLINKLSANKLKKIYSDTQELNSSEAMKRAIEFSNKATKLSLIFIRKKFNIK